MTLLAGAAAPVPEPRTHVLVIGVGDYPNTKASSAAQIAAGAVKVTPLGSPVPSASKVAEWFLNLHNPAAELGSLEAGKDADFVVLSGPPFSTYTKVLQTYIDGRPAFDRDKPTDWA